MKAQKTIKVSDQVHDTATRLAEKMGISKSLLIDLLLKKAEKENVSISLSGSVVVNGHNNSVVAGSGHKIRRSGSGLL